MRENIDYSSFRCNKKEDHFSRWLADVESHPLCRKLQLKDMLPVEMQRLVKYPMLLETAAKYTQEENEVSYRTGAVWVKSPTLVSECSITDQKSERACGIVRRILHIDSTIYNLALFQPIIVFFQEEQEKLYRVVHESKKILSAVNTAKRNAENLRRLEELQRRMDTTPFDKENSGHDYASLDLTKYVPIDMI